MWSTIKGFCVVKQKQMFSGIPFFLRSSRYSISVSSVFSKSNLYIWKFSVHGVLKPSLKDFEHYLASMWNECSCEVVWSFFGIEHLWDWSVNWPFPVLWPLLSFPNLLVYWVQHLIASSFRIWNSSTGILSPQLSLFLMSLSLSFSDILSWLNWSDRRATMRKTSVVLGWCSCMVIQLRCFSSVLKNIKKFFILKYVQKLQK